MIELMALPVRLGGLEITNPIASHHDASMKITGPLTTLIMEQSHQYPSAEQIRIKNESVNTRKRHQSQAAVELKDKLPNIMQRAYQQRKGRQAGYPLYQLQNVALHCTVLFLMLCASDMAGIH